MQLITFKCMNITNNMPVWLFRCNYIDLGSKMPQYKDVTSLYEHNRCPITILYTETWDKHCYETLLKGEKVSHAPSYVDRFIKLAHLAKEQDVLIILEYKDDGKGTGNKPEKKIGIIRKGSSIESKKDSIYELFYLELDADSVITIPKNQYTILNGLIPSNVTLGPVLIRATAVNELYHFIKDKTPITLTLQNFPNERIEDLCTLWLKSKYADEIIRLEKVYIENGQLNFPVLDILGKTSSNNVLAAQVSYTENENTILSKMKMLNMIKTELHLMFTKLSDEKYIKLSTKGDFRDIMHVSLDKVWTDLYNDCTLREKVEELFINKNI